MHSEYDVIVAGSGPGGFPAAAAAARMGLKTLLIEQNSFLGGLLVSGLPILAFFDRAGNKVVGGIAQEFIDRLLEVGGSAGHLRVPVHNSLTMINRSWSRIIIAEMCTETGMDIMLYTRLEGVKIDNGRIAGITVNCRGEIMSFKTRILIDATGDACAAFLAGAGYEKGEKLQPPTLLFHMRNFDYADFRQYLEQHPETMKLPNTFAEIHQNKDQFTDDKPWAFLGFCDLVEQGRKAGDFTLPRNMIDLAHWPHSDQVFLNVTRSIDTDVTNTKKLIDAEFECLMQIKELVSFLKKYCPGFKNADLCSIQSWVGARESRRITGRKILTEDSLAALPVPDDTVAIAAYNVDIHGQDSPEMKMLPVAHGIGIPYGCLLPKDVEGLIMSGRTISVDQTIFAMTRVMASCMAVGHAAGIAAGLAFKAGIPPSRLDTVLLRRELRKQGGILELSGES
jgi:hypothetical protein